MSTSAGLNLATGFSEVAETRGDSSSLELESKP
jgi:hypothetical protein